MSCEPSKAPRRNIAYLTSSEKSSPSSSPPRKISNRLRPTKGWSDRPSRFERSRQSREEKGQKKQADRAQGKRSEKGFREVRQNIKQSKEKPCFQPSGILQQYYNLQKGIQIKYAEPEDKADCEGNWRLYPYLGDEARPALTFTGNSKFIVGSDHRICDVVEDTRHLQPQHAVIQFRRVSQKQKAKVLPFIIDLGSRGGTFLNDQRIEASKYYQLLAKDEIRFGRTSPLEYVIIGQSD